MSAPATPDKGPQLSQEEDLARRAEARNARWRKADTEDGGAGYWKRQGYEDDGEIAVAVGLKEQVRQLTANDEPAAALLQAVAQQEAQKFNGKHIQDAGGNPLTADMFRFYHVIIGSTVNRDNYWPPHFDLPGVFTGDILMAEIDKRVTALKAGRATGVR